MSYHGDPGDPDPMTLPGHLPVRVFGVYGVGGALWARSRADGRWHSPGRPLSYSTFAFLDLHHGPCHLVCSGRTIPLPRAGKLSGSVTVAQR